MQMKEKWLTGIIKYAHGRSDMLNIYQLFDIFNWLYDAIKKRLEFLNFANSNNSSFMNAWIQVGAKGESLGKGNHELIIDRLLIELIMSYELIIDRIDRLFWF